MLRVVVDPGVLLAALISPPGAPATMLRRWVAGDFPIVYSTALVTEFVSVADRPKFRPWFSVEQGRQFAEFLRSAGEESADLVTGAAPPPDPGDAYLVDLVVSAQAWAVVTGDRLLVAHRAIGFPALGPREFLDVLQRLESPHT